MKVRHRHSSWGEPDCKTASNNRIASALRCRSLDAYSCRQKFIRFASLSKHLALASMISTRLSRTKINHENAITATLIQAYYQTLTANQDAFR